LPRHHAETVDYVRAGRLLARRDPVLRLLIRRHGDCGLARASRTDPFHALVHAIIAQQLSTRAAASIERRVMALYDGGLTPLAMRETSDARLRTAGISPQKLRYLRDLCHHVLDGALDLGRLDELGDDEVVASLTRVTGIGRWTAEMFLMFRLRRPDVLPVGDLGIVRAVQKAYRLRSAPSPERLATIGDRWRPYRSVACWYLWASLDGAPPVGGSSPDPRA
jgi:DNA-3-methyladenine glycosylase II